jgi:hypothetical protein
MSQIFAEVVEHVKQLSLAEKQAFLELLRKYLIEERRLEILENGETGLARIIHEKSPTVIRSLL